MSNFSPFKLPCIIIGHQLLLRLKIMSLLEQFDKKSARQRTSFLVLLSETRMRRIHCSVCSMKRLYRKRTQVSAKSLFIFSNSTLHAELDETKHAFNFLALRIFENLITKASFFVFFATNWKFKKLKGSTLRNFWHWDCF